jgi:hypothetical protein
VKFRRTLRAKLESLEAGIEEGEVEVSEFLEKQS